MATRRVELGPTGDAVRANLARLRKRARMTLRDVAEKLSETDRPLAHNTISEIERGARRVDVDDLVALAAALGVSPIALLNPPGDAGDGDTPDESRISGVPGVRHPHQVWEWLRANAPLDFRDKDWDMYADELDTFRRNNFPLWAYQDDKETQRLLQIADPEKLQDELRSYVESVVRQTIDRDRGPDGDD